MKDMATIRKSTLRKIRRELLGEISAIRNRYFDIEEPAATIPLKELIREIDAALAEASTNGGA